MNVWFLYILWKWRSTKLIGLNFIDNVLCLMLKLQPIGDSRGMPDPWLPRGHELCGHCGRVWTRRVCSQCGNSGGSTVVRFFYFNTCFPTLAIKICKKKYFYLVIGCVSEHEILYQFSFWYRLFIFSICTTTGISISLYFQE